MFGLMVLTFFGVALLCFIKGTQFLMRAIQSREDREDNILKSIATLSVTGFLTWPFLLGPAAGKLACSVGVGLQISERIDLGENGYEVDWPNRQEPNELFEQSVEDVFAGRIAFFETSSHGVSENLERIALGPDDSLDCVQYNSQYYKRNMPEGYCLEARPVRERASRYRLETSSRFWKQDAFQRSIRLVERDSDHVVASYTIRQIPNARMGGDASWVRDYRCPEPEQSGAPQPEFRLASLALVDGSPRRDSAAPTNACALPLIPEGAELHRYRSYAGRLPVDIRIDKHGSLASENFVYVNRPGVPVILRLSAHDPVIWRIRQTTGSNIVAVIAASGQSGVAVTGVDSATTVLINSGRAYSRMGNCSGYELSQVDAALRKLQTTSDVEGDKQYASSREVIPLVIGRRLHDDNYIERGDVSEAEYVLIDYPDP